MFLQENLLKVVCKSSIYLVACTNVLIYATRQKAVVFYLLIYLYIWVQTASAIL